MPYTCNRTSKRSRVFGNMVGFDHVRIELVRFTSSPKDSHQPPTDIIGGIALPCNPTVEYAHSSCIFVYWPLWISPFISPQHQSMSFVRSYIVFLFPFHCFSFCLLLVISPINNDSNLTDLTLQCIYSKRLRPLSIPSSIQFSKAQISILTNIVELHPAQFTSTENVSRHIH